MLAILSTKNNVINLLRGDVSHATVQLRRLALGCFKVFSNSRSSNGIRPVESASNFFRARKRYCVSSDETLLTADRFRVARLERTLADGSIKQRDVVRHPGSVVILPILPANRVCLIKNFRIAVDRPLIELPAGTLETNEVPLACAKRELTEETGYAAGAMTALTSFYAAPGILDELMHLFLASELVAGQPNREVGEEIENLILPLSAAISLIHAGDICDAKTIVGLLWYQQFQQR